MFKINDIVVCKKDFTYNKNFVINDKFIVILYNEYNVRLKSLKYNTYHNISYRGYDKYNLYYGDIFYSTKQLRKLKIKKIC